MSVKREKIFFILTRLRDKRSREWEGKTFREAFFSPHKSEMHFSAEPCLFLAFRWLLNGKSRKKRCTQTREPSRHFIEYESFARARLFKKKRLLCFSVVTMWSKQDDGRWNSNSFWRQTRRFSGKFLWSAAIVAFFPVPYQSNQRLFPPTNLAHVISKDDLWIVL